MQGNGDPRQSRRARSVSVPGVVDEIEVRGPHRRLAALPKILDRILQMGGTLRDPRVQDRRPPSPTRAMPGSRSGPTAPEAIDAILGDLVEHGASPVHPEDAQDRPGRHRRRLPRGLLQHDQPADPGPPRAAAGSTCQDQEMDCGIARRSRGRRGPVRADDPRSTVGHADRRRPRGGAGAARRAAARADARSAS